MLHSLARKWVPLKGLTAECDDPGDELMMRPAAVQDYRVKWFQFVGPTPHINQIDNLRRRNLQCMVLAFPIHTILRQKLGLVRFFQS